MVKATGLNPNETKAHTYINVDGYLTRVGGPSGDVSRKWPIGTGAVTRAITQDDRNEAVRRLSETIQTVNLTESQLVAIEKATRQNSGTQYSAVIR